MIFEAWISIAGCLVALVLTILLVKKSPATLALPLSYMINLLLIHVPGAYAFAVSGGQYSGLNNSTSAISTGILLTALSSFCFIIGYSFSVFRNRGLGLVQSWTIPKIDRNFVVFCLVSGWILSFGVGFLRDIPTVGAAIFFGSAVWMLAAMTSLAAAVENRDPLKFMTWLAVLFAYPFFVLIVSGFMSYGAIAVIIVGSLAVAQITKRDNHQHGTP